jgi:hypothetical protein
MNVASLSSGLTSPSPARPSSRATLGGFQEALATAMSSQAATPATSEPQDAEALLADVQQSLHRVLAAAGIDTSQPIRLETDRHGGLRVGFDHPDADRIEAVLAERPELVAKVQQLAALCRQNVPEDAAFQSTFTLVLEGERASVLFE